MFYILLYTKHSIALKSQGTVFTVIIFRDTVYTVVSHIYVYICIYDNIYIWQIRLRKLKYVLSLKNMNLYLLEIKIVHFSTLTLFLK